MRKDGNKPNCCEKGNEYIWWHIAGNISDDPWGSTFTGWGMVVGYLDEDIYEGPAIRQMGYCPFCGKKLNWIDVDKGEIE